VRVEFLLGTRANTDVLAQMAQCTEAARWHLMSRDTIFYWDIFGGYSDPKNASMIASHFLATDCSYMIMIDRDMVYTPDDIVRLMGHMRAGYDIVSGIYSLRNGIVLTGVPIEGDSFPIDGRVQEFKYVTSGFTGYSRKFLEALIKEYDLKPVMEGTPDEYYALFEEKRDPETGATVGWDWDLCDKARATGFQCYADTALQVGHMGDTIFTVSALMRRQQEILAEAPLRDAEIVGSLAEDFAEYFDIPLKKLERLMRRWGNSTASNEAWLDNTGSNDDFYRDNVDFLAGLIVFNQRGITHKTRYEPLMGIQNSKIFDLGCGFGTLVFMLAANGNEVVGYDINNKGLDFAEWLAKKYNRNGTFIREMPDTLAEFDIVTATDVLEHIEDLGPFLRDLGAKMSRGAMLYHFDAFADVTAFCHFDHRENIYRWLREAGFRPLDSWWAVKI